MASRAAVLGSLLPADAGWKISMHMLGIDGDPVPAKKLIAKAKMTGEDRGLNVYSYPQPNMAVIFRSG